MVINGYSYWSCTYQLNGCSRKVRLTFPILWGGANLVRADQKVRASRSNRGVAIEVVVGVIAVRQLEPRQYPERHVFQQAGVHAPDAHVAEIGVVVLVYLAVASLAVLKVRIV